tara:strand:- start:83 stop:1471 length:1389 start_codon:yes stop_codon:yes gene_type:complete
MKTSDGTPTATQRWAELAASHFGSNIDGLSEFIDNSLDAGATNIDIEWKPKKLIYICDNGAGCDNPDKLMGESSKTDDGSTTGRYGVGMKQAAIGLAGGQDGGLDSQFVIKTGGAFSPWVMSINWSRQDNFQFPWENVTSDLLGTNIRITGSSIRGLGNLGKLLQGLSRRYWDALHSGVAITINGRDVPAPFMPAFDPSKPSIEKQDLVWDDGSGRSAEVEAGVLYDQRDPMMGVNVFVGSRSIIEGSSLGCGEYTCKGMFAIVRLKGRWRLHVNKINLSEEHKNDLRFALEPLLEPILKTIVNQSRKVEDAEWRDRMLAALNPGEVTGKENRKGYAPKTAKPGRTPRQPGLPRRKRRNVKVITQGDGDARGRRSNLLWSVDIFPGDDPDCFLKIDRDGRTIQFYECCVAAREVWNRRDEETIAVARSAIAFAKMKSQLTMSGNDEYGAQLAKLYAAANSEN